MRLPLSPAVLLLGAAGASAQPVTDFQLPPDPEATPTSRPEAEGPTDLKGDTISVPRVIGTPTPTPRPTLGPTPSATQRGTPSPAASPRSAQGAPASSEASGGSLPASDRSVSTREVLGEPRQRAPQAQPPTTSSTTDTTARAADTDTATNARDVAPSEVRPEPEISVDGAGATTATSETAEPAETTDPSTWAWLAGALAALLALAAVIAMRMRRRPVRAPQAETPDLSGPPLREVTTHSYFSRPDAGSLEVEAHAVTLNRSVMNASISYRLILTNRGRQPITLIEVQGDVTTAHGQIPAEQQLADPAQTLPELHRLARLEPGQRSVLQGEVRLPLREVRAIRQGSVPVFVPLLRLTVRADNLDPQAHTYVIGTRNAQKGARPNPFRLDEPPRTYAQLTTRALG